MNESLERTLLAFPGNVNKRRGTDDYIFGSVPDSTKIDLVKITGQDLKAKIIGQKALILKHPAVLRNFVLQPSVYIIYKHTILRV